MTNALKKLHETKAASIYKTSLMSQIFVGNVFNILLTVQIFNILDPTCLFPQGENFQINGFHSKTNVPEIKYLQQNF
jgi:hypothetical protein